MKMLIRDWLDHHEQQLTLFEGDDGITLKRQEAFILVEAQLTSTRSDNTTVQNWLRLGAASLNVFQGALAQKADSGALWLIQTLRGGQGEECVLGALETLLNQRDTWRSTFAHLAPTVSSLKPTSLRSLSY